MVSGHTNHHVISGKCLNTDYLLDRGGRTPDTLRVYVPYRKNEDTEEWITTNYDDFRVKDEEGHKLWTEMSVNSKLVDVAVLPVQIDNPYIRDICSAEEPMNEDAYIEMGSEAFVIGFPFGKLGGFLPIWKRASIASSVLIDTNGLPFFCVDTASKAGMSGSPVVYYEKRAVVLENKSKDQVSRHFTKFLGIYSGRLIPNSGEDAQIGQVWRADVISELIERSKANKT